MLSPIFLEEDIIFLACFCLVCIALPEHSTVHCSMAAWLVTLNFSVLNNDYSVYAFVCVPHLSSAVFGKLPND